MSKLAELAATRSPINGQWEPPPEIVPDLLAARANGYGWMRLSKALRADGIDIGKNGVQAWFERRELAASDSPD